MFELRNRKIYRSEINRVVALVPADADLEAAALLVGQANLAERDEAMLDEIGRRASDRNLL